MSKAYSAFLTSAVLLLASIAQTANAATIFSDDFQSDTATLRSTTGDFDPVIGAGDVGGAWFNSENAEWVVQVVNDETPWVWGGAASDNNYLVAERVKVDDVRYQGGVTIPDLDPNVTGNQVVKLSASIFVPSITTGGWGVSISGWNLPSLAAENLVGTWWNERAFDIYFHPDGNVYYYDGAALSAALMPYNMDAWQDFTLTADTAAKTFTLDVEGTEASGLWTLNPNAIQSVLFNPDGDNVHFAIDNVMLTVVPEPSVLLSLIILGVSSLTLFRRV